MSATRNYIPVAGWDQILQNSLLSVNAELGRQRLPRIFAVLPYTLTESSMIDNLTDETPDNDAVLFEALIDVAGRFLRSFVESSARRFGLARDLQKFAFALFGAINVLVLAHVVGTYEDNRVRMSIQVISIRDIGELPLQVCVASRVGTTAALTLVYSDTARFRNPVLRIHPVHLLVEALQNFESDELAQEWGVSRDRETLAEYIAALAPVRNVLTPSLMAPMRAVLRGISVSEYIEMVIGATIPFVDTWPRSANNAVAQLREVIAGTADNANGEPTNLPRFITRTNFFRLVVGLAAIAGLDASVAQLQYGPENFDYEALWRARRVRANNNDDDDESESSSAGARATFRDEKMADGSKLMHI